MLMRAGGPRADVWPVPEWDPPYSGTIRKKLRIFRQAGILITMMYS